MKAYIFLLNLIVTLVSIGENEATKFVMPKSTESERFIESQKNVKHARIIGGVECVPHSKPYQVGLFLTLPNGTVAFCGGTLISSSFILTTAHCIYDGDDTVETFTVVLGAHDIQNETESVRIESRTAILHPEWDPSTFQNDIALIELPTEAPIAENYIDPLILPPYGAAESNFTGNYATVSGWGKDSDDSNTTSEVLREVTNQIISSVECNETYLGIIGLSQICVDGTDGTGTCNGDSGGPLTMIYGGRNTLIGVVSFGTEFGCEVGWPRVYTRITSYLDWISNITGIEIQP